MTALYSREMLNVCCGDTDVDFTVRSVASCNVSLMLSVHVSSPLHITRCERKLNMNDEAEEVKNKANITQFIKNKNTSVLNISGPMAKINLDFLISSSPELKIRRGCY